MNETALDHLYGVIATPVRTLRQIAEQKPIGWAIGIVIATSLLDMFRPKEVAALEELFPNLSPGLMGPFMLIVGLALLLGLFGVIHLLARTFGYPGSYIGLVSAQGFSRFPSIFYLPLALLAQVMPGAITAILNLALGLWLAVLQLIAIRETYGLSTGAALLTWIGSIIAFSIILAVVGLVGVFGSLGLGF